MPSDKPPLPPVDRPSLGPVGPDGLPRRFGKYTLLRKLAAGGMAELFLALHRSVAGFEKLVVIKRILPAMNQDQAFIDMLLHEARVAASLSHPNIVQTFDVGQIDGTYFIAMEHIHGEDVRSVVRAMRRKGVDSFPIEHALAIALGTCAGLAYAHEKRDLDGKPLQIVHRDISPQNVVLTFSGDVKIVDFGIAKSGTQIGEDTKSGQLKGKVPYMSPEQAAGEAVDWRSDVFAVGVLLFELTTGRRLFKGANELETLKLILERDYPLPSSVRPSYPRKLEPIVMKALAKRKEDRYASAGELQADLEQLVRDERVPVSTVALGRWMQWLFDDKLAQQNEALQDVKALADVIASQQTLPEDRSSEYDPPSSFSPSHPGAARTISVAPARAPRPAWLVPAAAVASAVVIAGAWAALRPAAAPAPAPASVAPAAALRGSLRGTSEPPGAAIWVDGDPQASRTPATVERLPLGQALAVRITRDGFEPFRQEVTLTEGARDATLAATLTPIAPAAPAEPSSGAEPAKAPDPIAAPVAAPTPNGVPNGAPKPAPNTPNAPPPAAAPAGRGKLNVAARGGYCNVSVDGAAHGPTPVAGVVLGAGAHRVTCVPESGASMSQTVKIEADQTARVSFTIP